VVWAEEVGAAGGSHKECATRKCALDFAGLADRQVSGVFVGVARRRYRTQGRAADLHFVAVGYRPVRKFEAGGCGRDHLRAEGCEFAPTGEVVVVDVGFENEADFGAKLPRFREVGPDVTLGSTIAATPSEATR
jgi:hypothetical protein